MSEQKQVEAEKTEPALETGSDTWTLEGLNCDGLGAPPSISFTLYDGTHIRADPPGARIFIDYDGASAGVDESRIRLWDTEARVLVADLSLRHVDEPRWEEWKNLAVYACETAAALYWSMWRASEIRKRARAESEAP
jgi:hypothetical protein